MNLDNNGVLKIMIRNEVKKVLEKFNLVYPDKAISYDNLTIDFSLRGVTAGTCNYNRMRLNFNLIIAQDNLITYLNRTIPHEISHLFTDKMYPGSAPHGWQWYKILHGAGYNDMSRCHSYDITSIKKNKNKFLYTCNCGKLHHISNLIHKRILNGQKYSCKACKKNIRFVKMEG